MTGFDEREKGFERKFERDQELAFRVRARRNRLLGAWAAERMGLAAAAADSYARDIAAALAQAGDGEVIDRIVADLAAKNFALDRALVTLELERCASEARRQLGPG
jgi:hypothetical protein